ncbi:hypothetical protein ALC62_07787 [Cyphomyrmex costatus]|uniref:Uncharacterized protein n=1 Tax=Cyphomyrmex costatus TaxID=456900 RepID=A0A151IHK3_9HYME|nr:hypothetical protein ALC62_07787 [Cyphomyrmex costatus]
MIHKNITIIYIDLVAQTAVNPHHIEGDPQSIRKQNVNIDRTREVEEEIEIQKTIKDPGAVTQETETKDVIVLAQVDRILRIVQEERLGLHLERSHEVLPVVHNRINRSQVLTTKDDFPIEPRIKDSVLEEINADGFIPKQFTSSATKESKFKNIVIDISSDTIQLPLVSNVVSGPESIFHTSIMMDQKARFDKWVRKLYTLRQKAITDFTHINIT